jgi:hypothetical protein
MRSTLYTPHSTKYTANQNNALDVETFTLQNDQTLFTRLAAEFESVVIHLLSQSDVVGISSILLRAFQESYGLTAFRCRYPQCSMSCPGFASQQLRAQHETMHFQRVYCSFSTCQFSRIGFAKKAALNTHIRNYHADSDTLPIPTTVRRLKVIVQDSSTVRSQGVVSRTSQDRLAVRQTPHLASQYQNNDADPYSSSLPGTHDPHQASTHNAQQVAAALVPQLDPDSTDMVQAAASDTQAVAMQLTDHEVEQDANQNPQTPLKFQQYYRKQIFNQTIRKDRQKMITLENRSDVAWPLYMEYRLRHPDVSEIDSVRVAVGFETHAFKESATAVEYFTIINNDKHLMMRQKPPKHSRQMQQSNEVGDQFVFQGVSTEQAQAQASTPPTTNNHAVQDYQMQLMLREQMLKKAMLLEREIARLEEQGLHASQFRQALANLRTTIGQATLCGTASDARAEQEPSSESLDKANANAGWWDDRLWDTTAQSPRPVDLQRKQSSPPLTSISPTEAMSYSNPVQSHAAMNDYNT